ncbi:alpha/beta hydrolase [Subtercola sp. YIM 133946]|uniref:alpha/beta hydrolase n=1 Tax=Subtercola sp. YIM 133946 TaxID=3118909 RepID=UPI002F95941A
MHSDHDQKIIEMMNEELLREVVPILEQGEPTPERWRIAMQTMDRWKNHSARPDPEIGSYHAEVPLRPALNASIAVPLGDGPFPVVIITHGNGLSAGSSHLYRRFTSDVAASGYLAITPDFRLAPEHPFPAAHDDLRFTLEWARDHATEFAGDPSRLVLWGDSFGAALALGLILHLQTEPEAPTITAFVGSEGVYNFNTSVLAFPGLAEWYSGGNKELLTDKRVSPIYHIDEGAALPSILLIAGSGDSSMFESVDLALALQRAGHDFELYVVEGMPHMFMTYPDLDGMREGHRLMFDYLARTV